MALPPQSLPLRFSLCPSLRSGVQLIACVSARLNGIDVVRLLDPEPREPFVALGRLFAAAGLTPIRSLARFKLRKPAYDVDLARLAPFKEREKDAALYSRPQDIWAPLADARRIADELGVYIMDEADLECHGAWRGPETPSVKPSWKDAYVERMKQLVHRDKNSPSVVMWSLGNEAYYGRNHRAMYEWSKSYDKTRPVHYEQDHEFRSSDVCSFMYLSVDDLIEVMDLKSITRREVSCYGISAKEETNLDAVLHWLIARANR